VHPTPESLPTTAIDLSPVASPGLKQELLRLLGRQARRIPVPVFLATAIIAALANGRVPTWVLAIWLGWVAVVLAVRWVVLGRLPAASGLTEETRIRIAVVLSAVNGVTHGLSLGFFPYLPVLERAVQSMVLIGLCTGSVATTAGYMPIFLAYLVPTLGSLAVLWAFSPGIVGAGWIELSTSALIFLLGVILIALARDAFRLFHESFEIRLQQIEANRQLQLALGRAEAASRAKTRFLASASHDLRQPIHTLSLFGAALTMCSLDERSREVAKHMNTALQALASQLDALLDISKLDAGIIRVHRGTLELAPFLRQLHKEFEPIARDKGLQLVLECPPNAFVDTDRSILERILRNLLDNAVKYTESGYIALHAEPAAAGFSVSVTDTGRGIPENEIDHVFEEFYQLDNPERDRTRGLGLGLAIVKRLADLLQITMELTSRTGEGSAFRLVLPAARPGAQAAESAEPEIASIGAMHVLVIDDEAGVRIGMKTLLEGMGCRVTLTDSTATAVTAARADAPDIVLADLRLHGEDNGIDAVRAVREVYPGIPAILISGDIAPDRLREAEQAGIPLLHKPVPFEALKQAIAGVAAK